MGLFNKQELERIKELEKMVKELKNDNNELMNKNEFLTNELDKHKKENEEKEQKIEELTSEIYELGVFEAVCHYEDSRSFEQELGKIKEIQKTMDGKSYPPMFGFGSSESDETTSAVKYHYTSWMWRINDSTMCHLRRGVDKLLIRAFNSECDNIISNVKFSNIEKSYKTFSG